MKDIEIIVLAINKMGYRIRSTTRNSSNDDIVVSLEGFNDETEYRFVSITVRGSRLRLSNCQYEIDLCDPDSLRLLNKAIDYHGTLPKNYSCSKCPLNIYLIGTTFM